MIHSKKHTWAPLPAVLLLTMKAHILSDCFDLRVCVDLPSTFSRAEHVQHFDFLRDYLRLPWRVILAFQIEDRRAHA